MHYRDVLSKLAAKLEEGDQSSYNGGRVPELDDDDDDEDDVVAEKLNEESKV